MADSREAYTMNEEEAYFGAMEETNETTVHKFAMVHCSSCGCGFGSGNHGYSACNQHEGMEVVED